MKMNQNYIIYRVKNIWTNQVYIGATTNSMKQRRLDHEERAKRGEKGKLHKALASWTNAFVWTQIDTANTIDELAQKEKEYIMQYDSKNKGYNSDAGGGLQKTVYQYAVADGSLIGTYACLEDAANSVDASRTCISSASAGPNKTCKGFLWSYSPTAPMGKKDERRKGVVQMDLNHIIVSEYTSVAEASRVSGLSKTCIARCCRQERAQSGGFIWKYK